MLASALPPPPASISGFPCLSWCGSRWAASLDCCRQPARSGASSGARRKAKVYLIFFLFLTPFLLPVNSAPSFQVVSEKKTTGGQGTQGNELPLKSPGGFSSLGHAPFPSKVALDDLFLSAASYSESRGLD